MSSMQEKEMGSSLVASPPDRRTERLNSTLPQLDSRVEKDDNGSKSSISSPKPISATEPTAAENGKQKDNLPPAAAELERSKLKTALIMFALCMAVFLAALDTTIITTALPTISQHFHSSSGYTWIGSAYLLGSASSVPVWAKISDIFGRKPILLAANVVFFVGSLVAALAYSIGMLIVARAIQGIGGGGLLTLVSVSIGDLFSMRTRGLYYGMVGFVWAIASAAGPLLEGVFTEKISWRWCFYINIPFQGIAFLIITFFLKKLHKPKTPLWDGLKAIDWIGSLAIVGGIIMFLLGLEYGGVSFPWKSATVICLLVFGVVTMVFFVFNEWKLARYPVIPLHIFSYRSNIACLLVCFFHGFVFIGGSFYLPLYFQIVLGKTPIISGVLLLANVLGLSIFSMGSGFYIRKTGQYLPPIYFGMAVMTLGYGLLLDLDAHSSLTKIILYQVVSGIGTGPNFQAPLIALQSLVPPADIASAVATFQLTRNIATSMSVVIGSVVFQNALAAQLPRLSAQLGPATAARLAGFSAAANIQAVAALPPQQRAVARDAFASSLHRMWIMYAVFAAAGLLCSGLITRQVLERRHEATRTGLAAEEEKRLDREAARRSRRESKLSSSGGAGAGTPASPRSPTSPTTWGRPRSQPGSPVEAVKEEV